LGADDPLGKHQGSKALLCEGVQVIGETGMCVGMCFLEDGGVCSFGKDDDFAGFCGVLHEHAHAFPGGEGQDIHQLVYDLLLLES
jgi:hypothetical protein